MLYTANNYSTLQALKIRSQELLLLKNGQNTTLQSQPYAGSQQ